MENNGYLEQMLEIIESLNEEEIKNFLDEQLQKNEEIIRQIRELLGEKIRKTVEEETTDIDFKNQYLERLLKIKRKIDQYLEGLTSDLNEKDEEQVNIKAPRPIRIVWAKKPNGESYCYEDLKDGNNEIRREFYHLFWDNLKKFIDSRDYQLTGDDLITNHEKLRDIYKIRTSSSNRQDRFYAYKIDDVIFIIGAYNKKTKINKKWQDWLIKRKKEVAEQYEELQELLKDEKEKARILEEEQEEFAKIEELIKPKEKLKNQKITWEQGIEYLKQYFVENGNIEVPKDYAIIDIEKGTKIELGKWFARQKARRLSDDEKKQLVEITKNISWLDKDEVERLEDMILKELEEKAESERSMKEISCTLNDSILKLGLSDETLIFLENLKILTIGDLVREGSKLKEHQEVINEINNRLKGITLHIETEIDEELKEASKRLSIDIKTPYSVKNVRNKEQERLDNEAKKLREQTNIEEIINGSINILELEEETLDILTKNNIKTIKDLLGYNAIELYINNVLTISQILKIETELNKYGLSIHKNNDINELIRIEKPKESKKGRQRSEQEKERWQHLFGHIKEIYEAFGHSMIPSSYRYDGIDLGKWLQNQKNDYKNGKLPQEYIEALESVEVIWSQRTESGKAKKKELMEKHGIEKVKLENGEIITYYKDGTQKSTADIKAAEVTPVIEQSVETTPSKEEIVTEESKPEPIIPEKVSKNEKAAVISLKENDYIVVKSADGYCAVWYFSSEGTDLRNEEILEEIKTQNPELTNVSLELYPFSKDDDQFVEIYEDDEILARGVLEPHKKAIEDTKEEVEMVQPQVEPIHNDTEVERQEPEKEESIEITEEIVDQLADKVARQNAQILAQEHENYERLKLIAATKTLLEVYLENEEKIHQLIAKRESLTAQMRELAPQINEILGGHHDR